MALFRTAEEHRQNPPETWRVVKVADRAWHLRPANSDGTINSYTRKSDAEADKVSGLYVRLYDDYTRWYASRGE